MSPTLLHLNGVPRSFLPYPPDGNSIQLHQDHWCSSQSRALNTIATMETKYKVDELLHNDKHTVRCSWGWKVRGYSHYLRTWLRKGLRKENDKNAHQQTHNRFQQKPVPHSSTGVRKMEMLPVKNNHR
jgi:hypothetical protein